MEMVVILSIVALVTMILFLVGLDALESIDARMRAHLALRHAEEERRRAAKSTPPAEDQPDWESWAEKQ